MKMIFLIPAVLTAMIFAGCAGSEAEQGASWRNLTTETYTREPYRLELSYPAGEIDFGSNAEFILRIEYPENESYILLPPDIENAEIYSNTVIVGIDEDEPVPDGNGRAVSTVTFTAEAWLPGDLVFPALTVSFGEILSTEQVVIPVGSAFEDAEQPRELSPLYIPDANETPVSVCAAAAGAAAISVAAIAAVVLFRRRRKKSLTEFPPAKTRQELIEDFRKNFIEAEGEIDLRAAFASFERIPERVNTGRYRNLIDEARFSKNGVSADEGRRILTELYLILTMEGSDEL